MSDSDRLAHLLMFVIVMVMLTLIAVAIGNIRSDIDDLTPTTTELPEQAHDR